MVGHVHNRIDNQQKSKYFIEVFILVIVKKSSIGEKYFKELDDDCSKVDDKGDHNP